MPMSSFLAVPSINEPAAKNARPGAVQKFRPPAVPLIAVDPYFSVWSVNDTLTVNSTKHWTGTTHMLSGLLRVDGKVYRFINSSPEECPELPQVDLMIFPTRTIYTFQTDEIEFRLGFQTPALPEDLEVFSWPLAYVQFSLSSRDGKPHEAAVYFDLSAEIAVDDRRQEVLCLRSQQAESDVIACGTVTQRILEKDGDNVRIDWGYLHLALPKSVPGRLAISCYDRARKAFARNEPFPVEDDIAFPFHFASDPKLSVMIPIDVDGATPQARYVIAAYDDLYSMEYHGRKLRPYWRRDGQHIGDLLKSAIAGYDSITQRCEQFDRTVVRDLDAAGGEEYARLASLAYRQTTAAHKLAADFDGTLLYFSKENFSNGCMGTVDVTYPSSPFFLHFNPTLLQAQLDPLMDYARSPRWKFPFAPHDLGVYPKANGQVYGGGERTEDDQMPVEECGNLIILATALTRAQGNTRFAERHWDVLSTWAGYLKERGFDPEKQLCTDDFAGHLAHNANLSIKAIVALGCYAQLCQSTGRSAEGRNVRKLAEKMVGQWLKAADDGGHYRLAFDAPGTWSVKYNLFWDKALHLRLFPEQVFKKELAQTKRKQQRYGLPLDNRKSYGKSDWTIWWASLCEKPADFRAFISPLYKWCQKTSSRVPLTDWYWTDNGRQVGFQARSVVGGFFAKLYLDRQLAEDSPARRRKPSKKV